MAIPKKHTIVQHKQSNSHLDRGTNAKSLQAFDIIPRSQVQPSVTARPVLTPTRPEQADNTLQTASQAASSQLMHQSLNFSSASPVTDSQSGSNNMSLSTAPTLASLITKHTQPIAGLGKTGKFGESDKADKANEANEVDDTSEYTSDGKPAPTITSPSVTVNEVAVTATLGPNADVVRDQELTPEPNIEPQLEPVAKEAAEPAPDSLEHALREDVSQPLQHSQALKNELKEMNSSDEPVHHELYGGKPVIVIHKAHGKNSPLATVLWIIACLLVALLIVDVLLDAGVIVTDYNVPHTRLLQ